MIVRSSHTLLKAVTHHGFAGDLPWLPFSLNPAVSDLISFPETSPPWQIFAISAHAHPRSLKASGASWLGDWEETGQPQRVPSDSLGCGSDLRAGAVGGQMAWWPDTFRQNNTASKQFYLKMYVGRMEGRVVEEMGDPHCSCRSSCLRTAEGTNSPLCTKPPKAAKVWVTN